MKNLMLLSAVGLLGLVLVTPASAQYFPGGHNHQPSYSPGFGGYNPGFGGGYHSGYGGYNPGYGGYNPGYGGGYGGGHIDVVRGGLFTPPHVDYHMGGRRYDVQPTPFGPVVSPFHHHGR